MNGTANTTVKAGPVTGSGRPRPFTADSRVCELVVTAVEQPTERVRVLHFAAPDGRQLPGYSPGANLQVNAGGKWNAYSLTGLGVAPVEYVIGVLGQSGGSRWIHDNLRVGDTVEVRGPENAFLPDLSQRRVFLVAGGIGVTPVVSYARAAVFHGWDLEVVYSHSAPEDAFSRELRELVDRAGGRFTEVGHRDELTAVLTDRFQRQPLGTRAYACGPDGMIELYRSVAKSQGWPEERLNWEHFGVSDLAPGNAFEYRVEGDPEGVTRKVPPGVSLLDSLLEEGRRVPYLCRQGVCGQCRLPARGATIEHRDHVLDDAERDAGDCILTCVSRGTGDGILEVSLP
ncbi:Phthalate dioxygenase reductase [Corynebacterium provencense]|jgi:ferredoxin-NADP reductase|uniref:Phthalate dioxygenase reductase n=1 Tax=Corynebacterium provencense TaxID=1737425 RepID=A0A2Z3YSD5_9CORY|nr:PDR/VanB family oxidoreductase [Corynebacterium provencense]AWT26571.1 Phthalate dioxygenase reductase [Corynebacterium provencense]MCI1257144.1 PDR/VanB family oxidoreductase [Corynebacterium provencense]